VAALWATLIAVCLLVVDSWLLPHYVNSGEPMPGFTVGFVPQKSWQGWTVARSEFWISALSDGSQGHGLFDISGRSGTHEGSFFIGYGSNDVLTDVYTFRVRKEEAMIDPTTKGVWYTISPKTDFHIQAALDWDAHPAPLGIGKELRAFQVSADRADGNGQFVMPPGSPTMEVVVQHQHGDVRFEGVQPSPTRRTQHFLVWQWPNIREPFSAEVVEVNDFARLSVDLCANLLFLGVGFFFGSLSWGPHRSSNKESVPSR
jgi:hypothetical protein